MIYFTIIVKEEDLPKYLKDPTYSKIVLEPRHDRTLRDYRLKCCLPVDHDQLMVFKNHLRVTSKNPNLPKAVREEIGGLYGYFSDTSWLGIHDMQRLKDLSQIHNFNSGIPKEYEIYLNPFVEKT